MLCITSLLTHLNNNNSQLFSISSTPFFISLSTTHIHNIQKNLHRRHTQHQSDFKPKEAKKTFLMASTSISNPDSSASRSREGESKRKKRRKIEGDEVKEGVVESDRTRWRTATEQQIYSSKLFEALRQIRRNDSPVIGGRTVRDTADRVLAVAAKGKTRWSRAILTSRLSLRLNQINRKHKRAKAISKGNVTGDNKLKRPAVKKKLPALQKKVRVLSRLVPGCRKLSFPNLLEETTDYISALQMQVRAMSVLTELLNGTGAGVAVGAGISADQSNWLGSNQS